MSTVNKVILVGNLGADPEIRQFQNGGKLCELRVATSERWKDRNTGETREKTEWHRVSVTQSGAVSFAEQYLKKGAKVYVEGVLQTRKWQDQSGQDRYTTEVVVKPYSGSLQALGSNRRGGQDDGDQGGGSGGGYYQGEGYNSGGDYGGGGSSLDDEIPF